MSTRTLRGVLGGLLCAWIAHAAAEPQLTPFTGTYAIQHGASVHFVTEELDGGPVVVQARTPVLDGDDETRLAARVLRVEHRIYPLAVGWFASGRLELRDGRPHLDGVALDAPVSYDARELLGDLVT